MLRRKGVVTVIMGVIMFVIIVVSIIFFMKTTIIKINAEFRDSQDKINMVDMAHLASFCLDALDGADALEASKGMDFFGIEGLPGNCRGKEASVWITDLETGEKWRFGSEGRLSHTVKSVIKNNGEVHAVEVYVSV